MSYPKTRLRRLRTTAAMRKLVCETRLSPADFMYPLFVCPGTDIKEPIGSMADCFHFSAKNAAKEAKEIAKLGIPAVILFGLPRKKDPSGSEAWAENSCLCAYTDHGHCGLIERGRIENDKTCDLLAKMALAHARAGADMVAPSDMMDGRVGVIRKKLDSEQLTDTAIMAYSAKYASAYYGPFRDASHSVPSEGDRKSYQMDPGNSKEAMREIRLDIEEGADIVMVKPALA
ncbi:MAG: porphobilinogen synthase, partial [Planctomycetota bacterium]